MDKFKTFDEFEKHWRNQKIFADWAKNFVSKPPIFPNEPMVIFSPPIPIGRQMDALLLTLRTDGRGNVLRPEFAPFTANIHDNPYCRYCGKVTRASSAKEWHRLKDMGKTCECDHPEEMYSQFESEEG